MSSPISPVQRRIKHARRNPEHETVGSQIIVPDLRQSADDTQIAYTEGVISEVHFVTGDEPDIITVDLDNGDRLYLDMTLEDQNDKLKNK